MSAEQREGRKSPRREALAHALVIAPNVRVYCVIRDVSETGAKLGIPHRAKLPPIFDVVLVQQKLKRRVALRWRNGDYAGVAFCDPIAEATRVRESGGETFEIDA